MIGNDAVPAMTASAASGASRKANRGWASAGCTNRSPRSVLQLQSLAASDLVHLVDDLLAASGIDQLAELG